MFLNKFTNNLDNAPLHSSGYAEVARPNKIGSMAPQSFNQRMHVERNRQAVGKYHHSLIANGHHRSGHYQRSYAMPARPGAESTDASATEPATSSYRRPERLIADVKPVTRQSFNEPTGRGYNPYQ